jgi:thymidylate synthase (FAD)
MKVEYINHMGDDLTVVNAARVSFDKESPKLNDKDKKLIKYLAKHNHWTPFAHAQIQLRITVPIFIANQLKRHQIGFALNEVSRRYVDDEPQFFTPEGGWRKRPDASIKQGSSDEVFLGAEHQGIQGIYIDALYHCIDVYQKMLTNNVAPELARMVLPQSMYTSWYWTGSLAAWARLYSQRIDGHAQKESQQIAQMVGDIIGPLYPVSWDALTDRGEN